MTPAKLDEAYARCQSEATAAFGSGDVYVERLIRKARHIEVQIVGDRHGAISHLWERECTIQRRHQKLIEIAPSPSLSEALRARIIEAAKQLAAAAHYDNLGTFEFLVDDDAHGNQSPFAFIEANPRLQVEHTVTEEVLGIDLVRAQLAIADGASLGSLGLAQAYVPKPRGYAVQLRVNMETMDETGATQPTGGTLGVFDLPSGPGVRVDTFGYSGYRTSAAFDSLLAKVIVHSTSPEWRTRCKRRSRACANSASAASPPTSRSSAAILSHPDFVANRISTGFIDTHIADLVGAAEERRDAAGRGGARPRRAAPMPRPSAGGSGGLGAGRGAAAGNHRHHRCRRGRSGAPRPADRRARSHEDGASRQRAAWRQGDEGRKPAAAPR